MHLSAEFQKIARRDKKAFLHDQYEIKTIKKKKLLVKKIYRGIENKIQMSLSPMLDSPDLSHMFKYYD